MELTGKTKKLGVEGCSFNGTQEKVNQTMKYCMFTPKIQSSDSKSIHLMRFTFRLSQIKNIIYMIVSSAKLWLLTNILL